MVSSLLLTLAYIVLTFLIFPLAVFGASAALMRNDGESRVEFACLTVPLSPIVLALLLAVPYSVGFASSSVGVIALVVIFAIACGILGRNELRGLLREMSVANLLPRAPSTLILLFVGGLLALVLLQALTMPLMENDSIEYLAVAKHIFERGSLSAYPLTEANGQGLYMPASHPPAYHLLLIWGFAWFGTMDFIHVRLLAVFVLAAFAMLFAYGLRDGPRGSVLVAMALLLCTPLFVSMVVSYHVDSIRMLAFLGAALSVARLIQRPTGRTALVTGFGIALAAFAHSIGVLAIAFGGLAWILLGPKGRFTDLRTPLIIGTVVVLVGGWHYLKNILIFGVPLHDTLPIWEMPEIDFATELRYRRDLFVLSDRLIFGVFRGFSELPLFGLLFWLTLGAFWFAWTRWERVPTTARVAIVWIGGYFTVALVMAMLGSELVIKNARYTMTIVPLAVLIVAPLIALVMVRLRWNTWLVFALILLLPGWMLIQSMWRVSHFAARMDIYTIGERAPIHRSNNRFPGAAAFRYLERNLKPGEKTFVFRQADFTLYGTGTWLDNFDERLKEFYRLDDVDAGVAWLRAQGVRYLLLPWYFFPTVSQTIVDDIIGDEQRTELVITARGYSLYRLRDNEAAASCIPVPDEQIELAYLLEQRTFAGTIMEAAGIPAPLPTIRVLPIGSIELAELNGRLPGHRSLEIRTGHNDYVAVSTWPGNRRRAPLSPFSRINAVDGTIALSFLISGEGMNGIDVIQYVSIGDVVEARTTRLWEGRALPTPRRVMARFKPDNAAVAFRFVIRKPVKAAGSLVIADLSICRTTELKVSVDERRVWADASVPLGVPAISWSPEKLTPVCDLRSNAKCNLTYVRGFPPNASEAWFQGLTLSTDGTPLGWRFRMRAVLETARLFLETYPESTVSSLLRPFYSLFEPNAQAAWRRHVLTINGSGSSDLRLYAQYRRAGGGIDWRHIGTETLSYADRPLALPFRLPADAEDIQIVVMQTPGDYAGAGLATINSIKLYADP